MYHSHPSPYWSRVVPAWSNKFKYAGLILVIMLRVFKKGEIPFWLGLLILGLIVLTLIILFNNRVYSFIAKQIKNLGRVL